jgi:hypothetical protein
VRPSDGRRGAATTIIIADRTRRRPSRSVGPLSLCAATLITSVGCAPKARIAPARAPEPPSQESEKPHARPKILLTHGSPAERATEAQLQRLFDRYDLAPWLYTDTLAIDEEAIPHSHPVLTLHTRHLRDDLLLLSTLIHEESHWYLNAHQPALDAAVAELEALVPGLPVGYPDGADSLKSSYEHLVVIALEERGLQRLVGELAAHEAMGFWATDHYRAVYRTVLEKRGDIRRVMRAHELASPGQ